MRRLLEEGVLLRVEFTGGNSGDGQATFASAVADELVVAVTGSATGGGLSAAIDDEAVARQHILAAARFERRARHGGHSEP